MTVTRMVSSSLEMPAAGDRRQCAPELFGRFDGCAALSVLGVPGIHIGAEEAGCVLQACSPLMAVLPCLQPTLSVLGEPGIHTDNTAGLKELAACHGSRLAARPV